MTSFSTFYRQVVVRRDFWALVPARGLSFFLLVAAALWCLACPPRFAMAETPTEAVFVGTANCESCHEEQYARFKKFSKKAHSWESVRKMIPKLTQTEKEACYSCHTTGYGRPGGFVSFERTPALADVGCETCHGPGSVHAESGDPSTIQRKPTIKQCETCHNAERIRNFNFKPLVYSGAH